MAIHSAIKRIKHKLPLKLRTRSDIVLAGFLFLIFAIGLWFFLHWQLDTSTPTGKKDAIQLWVQTLGGIVLFLGVYFTWRRLAATEKTVEIAQEGQITERFTRAIEQLGSDKLRVRLGAIYALERIARDSEKDHWPIMEVLTAYVRETSSWKEDHPREPNQKPKADIQAIMTVIGRRLRIYEHGEEQRLDLHGVDLRGANLIEAHLEGADLREAHLESADLNEAYMQRAILLEAHLEECLLSGIHLERANLISAHINGACLDHGHLEHSHLHKASLKEAYLFGAYLNKADLREADLDNAELQGADMDSVIGLTMAQLQSAKNYNDACLPDYLKSQSM